MRKKGLFFLLLVVAGLLGYNYLYQDHRDISQETAEIITTSDKITEEFANESYISEQEYLDKTIQVSGTITELNDSDLTLDEGVFCQFKMNLKENLSLGDKIILKGRCIGYDDLLEQVKLNECTLID